MENLPLISVALCTYNGEDFLKEQLDSILNQTYPRLEIVVVDDCSTDSTWSILQDYVSKNNIRLFQNSQNLGYNQNFEKAMRLCNGEKIAISDQDDIWDREKISLQYAAFRDNDLVYHDSELIDKNGSSMKMLISDKFNFYRGDSPEPFLFMNCVSGHSIMFSRSLIDKALPFPRGFYYDHWLAFVATSTGKIDFICKPLVKYRQHSKNNTDLLGVAKVVASKSKRIEKLEKETEWLKSCVDFTNGKSQLLISQLYQLSLKRNTSFAQISYGRLIWKNRKTLLTLLRKSDLSLFFFSLRKIWGANAKMLI